MHAFVLRPIKLNEFNWQHTIISCVCVLGMGKIRRMERMAKVAEERAQDSVCVRSSEVKSVSNLV